MPLCLSPLHPLCSKCRLVEHRNQWGGSDPTTGRPAWGARGTQSLLRAHRNTELIMGEPGELGTFQEYISPSEKSITLTDLVKVSLCLLGSLRFVIPTVF